MKKWLEKLDDPTRDVYERRYRLLSAASTLTLFLWIMLALAVDGYSPRILFFAVCDILFIPTMIFTLRTGRIQLGAGASGVVLVFLMLPFAFFFNGGIHAGAPNWCIIAMVFVTMTVRGRLRNFLLASDLVITMACYCAAWLHPELVDDYTQASAYGDSLASLIITGALMSIMFLFQLRIASQEKAILEAQQREILELDRSQKRFFSSMSHEIRTPVSTIIGLNEMILREDVSESVAENANQVVDAGRMLLHLVNDILDMSKLESGRMTLSRAEYDVAALLGEMVNMMNVHARKKSLEFWVDVDPQLPSRLVGDEVRVRQILINVLNNAVKYTERGSVTLSVQGKPDGAKGYTVIFSVSDTGQGIKKENIPYLFKAFKRVDTSENKYIEGTGLGLSIVKQFVDLMGGTITVNSVYRRGTTFLIELPQGDVGAPPIGFFDAGIRHAASAARGYAPRFEAPEARVLIVDDDAANRMVAEKLLGATRMRIDTAQNGEEALQKALTTGYHLIFMDHFMPGMDGVECLRRLRAQPGGLCKASKVVALTANADGEGRQLYAREGFDGCLIKPCGGDELEKECIRLLPPELVRLTRADDAIEAESAAWMRAREKREAVAVTTDSIADLPVEFLKDYGIVTLPHTVHTEEGNFRDGLEIEASGLVAYMQSGRKLAETLPPDVSVYETFFAEQLARANQVIHVSISSRVKGSACAAAREAAKPFENVTVVDSGHVSSGEGLLAMEASRLAREGLEPAAIAARLEKARARIHTSFVVDSLGYLERANLVGRRAAKIATALMIRPVLKLKDGEIRIGRIFLGSRKAAWRKYIAGELRNMAALDRRLLFVTYVGLSQKELGEIRAEIEKKGRFETVCFQKASPAIAANCGPGTFGLLYAEAEE